MSPATYALSLLAVPALLTAASSANALPLGGVSATDTAAASGAIVRIHGVHPSCMWGPVSPNGTGPSKYHRTPEAGVHILSQVPPRPGASGLTIKPRQPTNTGYGKLKLR